MSYRINNPGGGDCGFYAVAIALIPIIQREYATNGHSPVFSRWVKKGLGNKVALQTVLGINMSSLYQNHNQYQPLLLTLQSSLRNIATEAYKNDLFSRIQAENPNTPTLVEGSPIYNNFMELVLEYGKAKKYPTLLHKFWALFGWDETSTQLPNVFQFNMLARSREVRKLAQQTAVELAPQIKGKPFNEQQKIENNYVKTVFINDVNKHKQSCILRGVDVLKKPRSWWATHSDLNVIAEQLKVNLIVSNQINGKLKEKWPTMYLNNEANAHWTTTVEELPELPVHAEPKPRAAIKVDKIKIEQVIQATLSSQHNPESIAHYKRNLKELINEVSTKGLFSRISRERKIDITKIDTAEAYGDESNEDFALRLQEAEFRKAGLR